VRYASHHDEVFLGREMSQPRDHSEETARAIDNEVRRLIVDSEARAVQLMKDNIDILRICSLALIEREILDSEELDILIRGEQLAPMIKDVASFRQKVRSSSQPSTDDLANNQDTGTDGLALSPS